MLKFRINFGVAFDELGVLLQGATCLVGSKLLQYWQFLTDFNRLFLWNKVVYTVYKYLTKMELPLWASAYTVNQFQSARIL